MAAVVRAGRRSAAGQLAPAHGLCLWEVRYPERWRWVASLDVASP